MNFNPKVVNLPLCKASKTLSMLDEQNYPKLRRSRHVSFGCCEKVNAKDKDDGKKKNTYALQSQIKSCLNGKAPVKTSNTTRSSYIAFKAWQQPPNRYDISDIPYSRLKGSSGAFWSKTKTFKSVKIEGPQRHAVFIKESLHPKATTKQYKMLAADRQIVINNTLKHSSTENQYIFDSKKDKKIKPFHEERNEKKKYFHDPNALINFKKNAWKMNFYFEPAPGRYLNAKTEAFSSPKKHLIPNKKLPSHVSAKFSGNKRLQSMETHKAPMSFYDDNMNIKYNTSVQVVRKYRPKRYFSFGSNLPRFDTKENDIFKSAELTQNFLKNDLTRKLNHPIFKNDPKNIKCRYGEIPERLKNTAYVVENSKKLFKFLPLPQPKILVTRRQILKYSDAELLFGGKINLEMLYRDDSLIESGNSIQLIS